MRKIVFFDIDGTLVTHNNSIPASTKAAVKKLKENNILPVISTGRPPLMIKEVAAELGIHTVISMNGQYVVYEDEVIYENSIPTANIDGLARLAQKHKQGIAFCGSEKITGNSMLLFAEREWIKKVRPHIARIAPQTATRFVNKRVSFKPLKQSDYSERKIYQCILSVEEPFDDLYTKAFPQLAFTRSNPYSVDAISRNGSKALGMQKLLTHLNLKSEDAVAFGDGLNDLEMLQFAGVGVAMGNGRVELKSQADFITDSVWEDGIYNGLEKLGML